MPANDIKLLFVRLSEAEKRRIKTLAVSEGLTLRQATVLAYEAWAEKLQSPTTDPARGVIAGTDSDRVAQPKSSSRVSTQRQGAKPSTSSGQAPVHQHQTTPRQGRRPADEAPSLTPGSGRAPNQQGPSTAWLRRVAQLDLDWSKCPAAQRVQGKTGGVWVARGTRAPVAAILDAVAEGEPFLEIAEVFEISLQQLIAVLQFAAEGVAAASPVK